MLLRKWKGLCWSALVIFSGACSNLPITDIATSVASHKVDTRVEAKQRPVLSQIEFLQEMAVVQAKNISSLKGLLLTLDERNKERFHEISKKLDNMERKQLAINKQLENEIQILKRRFVGYP